MRGLFLANTRTDRCYLAEMVPSAMREDSLCTARANTAKQDLVLADYSVPCLSRTGRKDCGGA
jgi:hypothetical protein